MLHYCRARLGNILLRYSFRPEDVGYMEEDVLSYKSGETEMIVCVYLRIGVKLELADPHRTVRREISEAIRLGIYPEEPE